MKFYRKLPHLNNNKINNSDFRWAKDLNRLKMLGTICRQHRPTESRPPVTGMAELKKKEEIGIIALERLGCPCVLLLLGTQTAHSLLKTSLLFFKEPNMELGRWL